MNKRQASEQSSSEFKQDPQESQGVMMRGCAPLPSLASSAPAATRLASTEASSTFIACAIHEKWWRLEATLNRQAAFSCRTHRDLHAREGQAALVHCFLDFICDRL